MPGEEASEQLHGGAHAQHGECLPHGVHGLGQSVKRAVGLAHQGSGHGHVGAGNAVQRGNIRLAVSNGFLQLAEQFWAGRDDDVAHWARLAGTVEFVLDVLGPVRGCSG